MDQITDTIWIGNSQDAKNLAELQRHGIGVILNCAVDLPPALGWKEGIKHFHVGLIDGPGNGRNLYHSASGVVYHHSTRKEKILVHCHEGKSRSVFVVAMALASEWHEGHLSMIPKMIEFIKEKRPCTSVHADHLELFSQYA